MKKLFGFFKDINIANANLKSIQLIINYLDDNYNNPVFLFFRAEHTVIHLIYYIFYSTSIIAQLVRVADYKLSSHRFKSYLKNSLARISPTGGKTDHFFFNGDLSIFLKGFRVLKLQNASTYLVFSN